jgi:hypothetical protein
MILLRLQIATALSKTISELSIFCNWYLIEVLRLFPGKEDVYAGNL